MADPKKGLGLLLLSSKPKGDDDEEEMGPDSEGGSTPDEFADLAFDALKDDDKDAFKRALVGLAKACMDDDYDDGED